MKFLELFYKTSDTYTQDAQKYEELTEKYFEALKFYCAECKRGFDKKLGKNMHDRWNHKGNPPIAQNKQTEPVDNPVE